MLVLCSTVIRDAEKFSQAFAILVVKAWNPFFFFVESASRVRVSELKRRMDETKDLYNSLQS